MGFEFDLPAAYRIRVRGCLDSSWSGRLGGMEISAIDRAEGPAETTLAGWLPDQAALCGVLNALYDLHLSLISVELLNLEQDGQGVEGPQEDEA